MPFTPAHAVVALPFVRTPLVPAAIAIGAMTPDVPLYFRVGIDYWFTHSWLGMVAADLPIALALTVLWWTVLRLAVPSLVPRWIAHRLPSSWSVPVTRASMRSLVSVRSIILVIVSALIGIASHVLWDEVTHDGRWGSSVLPAVNGTVGPFTGWEWMQHVSSIGGLTVIAIWMVRWLRAQQPRVVEPAIAPRTAALLWLTVPVALIIGTLIVTAVRGMPATADDVSGLLGRGGTVGAALILAVFGVVSVVIAIRLHVRHARDASKFAGPETST